MEHVESVRKKAGEIVDNGRQPSTSLLASELDLDEDFVHRCLNILEKRGDVRTYPKEALGRKRRMVSVLRE